jgi:hypothetical protein
MPCIIPIRSNLAICNIYMWHTLQVDRRYRMATCLAKGNRNSTISKEGNNFWLWPYQAMDVYCSLVFFPPIFILQAHHFVEAVLDFSSTDPGNYQLFNFCHLSVRLIWHFDLKRFRPNEVPRVKISLACVFAFMAIGWPLIILKSGLAGWLKFWFMPWMVYHFWVTFLISHHHHMLKSTAFIFDSLMLGQPS